MAEQIFSKLAELIRHDYQATQELPGERALAERYACTRTTVRAALKSLQDRKLLHSNPRRGHRLVNSESAPRPRQVKTQWNVVMLASSRKMEDQNFLDFLGGVIHAARQMAVNLVIREIADHTDLVGLATLEQLHPGITADGYILTAFSDQLAPLLANLLTPCVVLGDSNDFDQIERKRFVQVYLPQREKIQFLVDRLVALGHRKILMVSPPGELTFPQRDDFAGVDAEIDLLPIDINMDSTVPNFGAADKVLAALGDHTALMICVGGATSLDIYRRVTGAGYEVPQRLSVTIDSGRYDYFIRVFDIASIYSSAREEGACCMDELFCQLRTGSVNFMIRKSHYTYRDGASIAMAMPPNEVRKFDQEHNLPLNP